MSISYLRMEEKKLGKKRKVFPVGSEIFFLIFLVRVQI